MARKQKMKVYHGIPKSITDEHTVFYADLDYSVIPNINKGAVSYRLGLNSLSKQVQSCTGGGLLINKKTDRKNSILIEIPNTVIPHTSDLTIEFFIKPTTLTGIVCQVGYQSNVYFRTYTQWMNQSITQKFVANQFNHFRLTVNKGTVNYYINGVKILEAQASYATTTYTDVTKNLCILIGGDDNASAFSMDNIIIADLHISSTDRGDYFPNLPQDFIKGKAIIKPRMGQQQIKGDPMYSQVTTLRVPHSVEGGEELYGNYDSSTSLEQNFKHPELFASHTRDWRNGARVRIKGLNSEIISGVIDNDTALFTALSSPTGNTLYVDSVAKISAGDQFKAWHLQRNVVDSGVYTVASVDANKKLITLTHNSTAVWTQDAINSGWVKGIEVTALSSSPTVKTEDGVVVNGTWSGLGTNEATFTVGTNSGIAGKDLYIQYALTMLYGNSDFTEIPYAAEKAWGENGVEMKPVDRVIILDDFKGKIAGRTKECANIIKSASSPQLQQPSSFTFEHSTAGYKSASVINDADNLVKSVDVNTHIPQQLFSFNLIEMVERKLGCEIPGENKVRWLKDNLANTSFNIYGYGVSPIGFRFYAAVYVKSENRWFEPCRHESGSSIKITAGTNADYTPFCIDDKGFIHYIAYTEATDGSTVSAVYTDYASLEITLKTDSDFTTLYCENTRARESMCNPILIQKETKTVERYLPSTECFVTECSYAEFRNEKVVHNLDILANKHFSVGVTTSQYSKYVKGSKINLNQLPLEQAEHLYAPINEHKFVELLTSSLMPNNITEIPLVYWRSDNGANLFTLQTTTNNRKTYVTDSNAFRGQRGGYKDNNNNIIIYGDIDKNNIVPKENCRLYSIALVIKNNELMLYVIKSSKGSRFYVYSDAITLIKLPNSPLIK